MGIHFFYSCYVLRSLFIEGVPNVFEDIDSLEGEVEPFAVCLMDGSFEFLKVLIPIFFKGLDVVVLEPFQIFRSAFSLLSMSVADRSGNNEVFVGLPWLELHDLQGLHLKGDINHKAQKTQRTSS